MATTSVPGRSAYVDALGTASVEVSEVDGQREFRLSSTATLRDGLPQNPRIIVENPGEPRIRTESPLFDALFALAVAEARENSVSEIVNDAFNDGAPTVAPPGGFFETGRKWNYVWTRDTAYALDLGLAWFDPVRSLNSLLFKLSERRAECGGGDTQIVSDTGSGGSYPISTDRVVWAFGAARLLDCLAEPERTEFARITFDALENTLEQDRALVFDAELGLYNGEQSFLDWREQSYPGWTAADTLHIGTSQALSTNVGHLRALRLGAQLGRELGATERAARYQSFGDALARAIHARFYVEEEARYATFLAAPPDGSRARRFDLLGTALCVLCGVAPESQRARIISSYPVLPLGPPVIWPQEPDTAVYHNRAIWPFVTAYFGKAARAAGHAAGVSHALESLLRGAALNLSNMENLEVTTGGAYFEDGDLSGPVINSQRQLWSVAGYLSAIVDVVLGLELGREGLRFVPFVTGEIVTRWGLGRSLRLDDLPIHDKRISVVVSWGELGAGDVGSGALCVRCARYRGRELRDGEFVALEDLTEGAVFEVELTAAAGSPMTLNWVRAADGYGALFAPRTPTIVGLEVRDEQLVLAWETDERREDVAFEILRDGALLVTGLPAGTRRFVDTSSEPSINSSVYSVRSYFLDSGNCSHHAAPRCHWTHTHKRLAIATEAGRGSSLPQLATFEVEQGGPHFFSVGYLNQAGPHSTGITCAVSYLEVRRRGVETPCGGGYLLLPHTAESGLRGSNRIRIELAAGVEYEVLVRDDPRARNMSERKHFAGYSAGLGGVNGPLNEARLLELRIEA